MANTASTSLRASAPAPTEGPTLPPSFAFTFGPSIAAELLRTADAVAPATEAQEG